MATTSTAFPPVTAPTTAATLISQLASPLETAATKPFDKEAFAIHSFQTALDTITKIAHLKPVKYGDLPVVDTTKRSLPEIRRLDLCHECQKATEQPVLPTHALVSTEIKAGHAFARGTFVLSTGEKVPFLAIRTYTWIIHYRGVAAHFCHTAYFHTNPNDKQQSYDLLGNLVEEPTTKLEGNQELIVSRTELDSESGAATHLAERYKQNVKTIPQLVGELTLGFQGAHATPHRIDTIGPHQPSDE
jgi:hypothetical protein